MISEPFFGCECGWDTGLPPAVTTEDEFDRRWDNCLLAYRLHKMNGCPLTAGRPTGKDIDDR